MKFRYVSLAIAESFDAWRIIPRTILILYSTLVFNLYMWYRSIPTYIQEQCEAGVLKILLDSGLTLEEAKTVACSVIDIVGGPTMAQSTFVTTIIGLSTGIFGLYVATGRRWDRNFSMQDNDNNPFNGPNYPYSPNRPFGPGNRPYGPDRPFGPENNYDPNNNPYGPEPNPYNPHNPHNKDRGPWGDSQLQNDGDSGDEDNI
jgi:hypothetical protein